MNFKQHILHSHGFRLLISMIVVAAMMTESLKIVAAEIHPDGNIVEKCDFDDSGYPKGGCSNILAAQNLCSNIPLSPLEGIWEYPADEVTLMILRNKWEKGHYDVYVVEAVDCRLDAGMRIGYAVDSADPNQFKLALCSKIKGGLPGGFINCLAKLDKNGESLRIQAPKMKLTLNPSLVLPVLWNKLRIGVRMKTNDPMENFPEGWIRVYPSYDGNGSSLSQPRYL